MKNILLNLKNYGKSIGSTLRKNRWTEKLN